MTARTGAVTGLRSPTGAVAAAVLAAGAAAEVAPDGSVLAAVLDWLAGAIMVAAALRTATSDRGASRLALLAASAWFLATAAPDAANPRLSAWLSLTTLAYRALLLHWVVHRAHPSSRRTRIWTGVPVLLAYPLALTGTTVSAMATIAAAGTLALVLAVASTRSDIPSEGRRPLAAASVSMAALAGLWTAGARGVVGGEAYQVLALGCISLVAWLGTQPADSRLHGAVGQLVLDLGPTGRPASPVAASLARALADPDLQIRTFHRDTGWTDELGRPYADPLTATVPLPLPLPVPSPSSTLWPAAASHSSTAHRKAATRSSQGQRPRPLVSFWKAFGSRPSPGARRSPSAGPPPDFLPSTTSSDVV